MTAAERPASALHQRQVARRHLHGGVRLATQLPHGFDDLRDAAAVGRMVVAQPSTVRYLMIATLVRDKLRSLQLRYPPADPKLKALHIQ